MRRVEILVFDGVEVLDFAGPFEVLSLAAQLSGSSPWDVALVGETAGVCTAVNGLRVLPNRVIGADGLPEVLIVPGGEGTRALLPASPVVDWLRHALAAAEVTLSVCSGARLLAALGVLDGRPFTSHHDVIDEIAAQCRGAEPRRDRRFVDTGDIVTTAGIAAGIDGALHLVARLLGPAHARRVAAYMAYPQGSPPE